MFAESYGAIRGSRDVKVLLKEPNLMNNPDILDKHSLFLNTGLYAT
jgi:hypothetical protein